MYRLKNVVSRDIGFEGKHGTANSIVDVEGVEVGHETIVKDIEQNGGKTIAAKTCSSLTWWPDMLFRNSSEISQTTGNASCFMLFETSHFNTASLTTPTL